MLVLNCISFIVNLVFNCVNGLNLQVLYAIYGKVTISFLMMFKTNKSSIKKDFRCLAIACFIIIPRRASLIIPKC